MLTSIKTRFVAASLAAMLGAASAQAADITGAGSTFVYPVLSKWSAAYSEKTGNKINYQSIGSGGGIAQIKAATVDFGASDKPLDSKELDEAGLGQFPVVIGGIVAVANVEGIKPGELHLNGPLLADIFQGKVKKWNDPAIAQLNSSLKLPDQAITIVHRSDGSGTSFNFTNYLSKVSADWKSAVGEGTSVQWPVGVGGKGNEGVSAYVNQIKGSIGYVEYAYALQNKMTYALLQNQAGKFVAPDDAAFKAAAAGAAWDKSFYQILTNQPGEGSWPITGATFILVHKVQDKPAQGSTVLRFFDWAYKNGDKTAGDLDYVPMPASVKTAIVKAWSDVKDGQGKSIALD